MYMNTNSNLIQTQNSSQGPLQPSVNELPEWMDGPFSFAVLTLNEQLKGKKLESSNSQMFVMPFMYSEQTASNFGSSIFYCNEPQETMGTQNFAECRVKSQSDSTQKISSFNKGPNKIKSSNNNKKLIFDQILENSHRNISSEDSETFSTAFCDLPLSINFEEEISRPCIKKILKKQPKSFAPPVFKTNLRSFEEIETDAITFNDNTNSVAGFGPEVCLGKRVSNSTEEFSFNEYSKKFSNITRFQLQTIYQKLDEAYNLCKRTQSTALVAINFMLNLIKDKLRSKNLSEAQRFLEYFIFEWNSETVDRTLHKVILEEVFTPYL